MENYSKLKSRPVIEHPKEAWDIIVTSGSKIKAIISKAINLLQETKEDKIVLTGFGPTVSKTITCAEIIKRKIQNLHQNNKLFYKRMEDTWEPKLEGLDRLIVTRNVPAIKIILSKTLLDVNEPGYQAPLNVSGKRKTSNVRRRGESQQYRREKSFGARPLSEPSRTTSTPDERSKQKIPQTKRFKTSKDK